MSKCSNCILCREQVVVSASQVAEGIKMNYVLAKVFVNLVCGDPKSITCCTLVWLVVSQATGQYGFAAQTVQLCDEYQDVFYNKPGLSPHRQFDCAFDLLDESLPPPKHGQYRLIQVEQAKVKQHTEQLFDRSWICASVLLYGAPILFVQKNTVNCLCMCIAFFQPQP